MDARIAGAAGLRGLWASRSDQEAPDRRAVHLIGRVMCPGRGPGPRWRSVQVRGRVQDPGCGPGPRRPSGLSHDRRIGHDAATDGCRGARERVGAVKALAGGERVGVGMPGGPCANRGRDGVAGGVARC